jgi:hypothetical protein
MNGTTVAQSPVRPAAVWRPARAEPHSPAPAERRQSSAGGSGDGGDGVLKAAALALVLAVPCIAAACLAEGAANSVQRAAFVALWIAACAIALLCVSSGGRGGSRAAAEAASGAASPSRAAAGTKRTPDGKHAHAHARTPQAPLLQPAHVLPHSGPRVLPAAAAAAAAATATASALSSTAASPLSPFLRMRREEYRAFLPGPAGGAGTDQEHATPTATKQTPHRESSAKKSAARPSPAPAAPVSHASPASPGKQGKRQSDEKPSLEHAGVVPTSAHSPHEPHHAGPRSMQPPSGSLAPPMATPQSSVSPSAASAAAAAERQSRLRSTPWSPSAPSSSDAPPLERDALKHLSPVASPLTMLSAGGVAHVSPTQRAPASSAQSPLYDAFQDSNAAINQDKEQASVVRGNELRDRLKKLEEEEASELKEVARLKLIARNKALVGRAKEVCTSIMRLAQEWGKDDAGVEAAVKAFKEFVASKAAIFLQLDSPEIAPTVEALEAKAHEVGNKAKSGECLSSFLSRTATR